MNRCLNVLKEAANHMIYGKDHDVVDIDYYKKEESGDDKDNDESIIILNKGRKRLRKPQKEEVLDLGNREDIVDDL